MFRTSIAILLNWLACSGIVLWLNDPTPWLYFALFDAIACVIVTVRPAARWQACIGGVFVAEMICHLAYGLSPYPNPDYYLDILDKLSIVQLMLLGCWGLGGASVRIARFADHHWLHRGNPLADRPPTPRMG